MKGEPSVWLPRSKTVTTFGWVIFATALRLALEAGLQLGVVRDLGDHDLEGHVAVEHGVVGQVDLAHGALAEGTEDLVLADPAGQLLLDRLVRIARLSHAGASGAQLPSGQGIRRQARGVSNDERAHRREPEGPMVAIQLTCGSGYFVLPVTVKWARRFRCQHSSLGRRQTGTSLP